VERETLTSEPMTSATEQFVRFILGWIPFIILAVVAYICVRLIFLKKPPRSAPYEESHGHLRE
jgi:hypothetical protein